jgi:hypothetical protein
LELCILAVDVADRVYHSERRFDLA